MTAEKWNEVKNFAAKHWIEATLVTLTASGAAAYLLIKFYRQKKLSEKTIQELDLYEQESKIGNQDAPVFLETATSVIGSLPGSDLTAKIMASSIPDEKGREVMEALSEMGNLNQKRRLKN